MTQTSTLSRTVYTAFFGLVAVATLALAFAPSASLYAG